METLVEEQGTIVTAQTSGERTSPSGQTEISGRISGTSAQVRANGTVVLTSPAQVKHVVTSAGSNTQAIAVPQPGGTVSIVHVAIPSQPVHVQSVIQPGPNQQSVIQATPSGTTLQSVQLSKNVILLNKLTGSGSVIHSTDAEAGIHPVQLISAVKGDENETVTTIAVHDESKKRREILARRPSYRKILNELSAAEAQGAVVSLAASGDSKDDVSGGGGTTESSQDSESGSGTNTIAVAGTQYATAGLLKVVPASTIQLAGSQDGSIQGIPTITMTNAGAGTPGTIVQYAQGQDGQFFVPVTVSAADLQAYQIRTTGGNSATALTQGVVMAAPSSNIQTIQTPQQLVEEASRKREVRLLKNREAAKECRRKKKEYIKCLENRVAVLENQNKALIEELKSLKELYCQKNE